MKLGFEALLRELSVLLRTPALLEKLRVGGLCGFAACSPITRQEEQSQTLNSCQSMKPLSSLSISSNLKLQSQNENLFPERADGMAWRGQNQGRLKGSKQSRREPGSDVGTPALVSENCGQSHNLGAHPGNAESKTGVDASSRWTDRYDSQRTLPRESCCQPTPALGCRSLAR